MTEMDFNNMWPNNRLNWLILMLVATLASFEKWLSSP